MTDQPNNHDRPDEDEPFASSSEQRKSWLDRRREKIVAEIKANQRGEYTVPTWVLAVALVAMIAAICTWLVLA